MMKIKKKCLAIFIVVFSLFYSNSKAFSISNSDFYTNTIGVKEKINISMLSKVLSDAKNKTFPNLVPYTHIPEFTDATISDEFPISSNIKQTKSEAEAIFQEIETTDNWVASLSEDNLLVLPVGIKHTINEVEYQLGFIEAVVNKDYMEFTVFVKVVLPQTNEKGDPIELFFGGKNVKLSHKGGFIKDADLVLLGDMFIPFNGGNWLMLLKGGLNHKTGQIKNKTYVTITCDGVKEMAIQGEIQFSRDLILPVDKKGQLLPETRPYQVDGAETIDIPNRVTGAFNITASDWNDIITDINIPPFVLANQPDKFIFTIKEAILDFSDIRNGNIEFPKYYQQNSLLVPSVESWRGVYMNSLEVSLPHEFKTEESIAANSRVTFEASDLMIDSYGVSAFFSVDNLIPLESGRTSSSNAWAYSVDHIDIEIVSSKFKHADFNGMLLLPVSEIDSLSSETSTKRKALSYKGLISENEYALNVSNIDSLSLDVFQAKAELYPNSTVELAVVNGNFEPKAILHGKMSIIADQGDLVPEELTDVEILNTEVVAEETEVDEESASIDFKGIEFHSLVLQTKAPYISAAHFGYQGEVNLGNFPISIHNISLESNDFEAGLNFDVKVNLMGEEDKGFSAGTRLGVYGKLDQPNKLHQWKYHRIDLNDFKLDASFGPLKFNGNLALLENDPVYGNGFSADIKGKFGLVGPISCKAIFGKNDFRYWYVDAAVKGLKIQSGPLQINGFAGGAFYRMTRKQNGSSKFSPSGLSYIPRKNAGLGVKAMLFGAIGDKSAISLSTGFEIEFNNKLGVNRLGLFGEAQMMKAFNFDNPLVSLKDKLTGIVEEISLIDTTSENGEGVVYLDKAIEEYPSEIVGEAGINANIGMEYDFTNTSFNVDLDVYVNIVGNTFKGTAPRGRAGWGKAYISPDEWYVHMGTPTDPLGLKMSIGKASVQTGAYFMCGDRIPESVPPPREVRSILGSELSSLDNNRNTNRISEGKGFAFGTNFKVNTGNIDFLMLYGNFAAGVGFDMMLKDYGNTSFCRNTNDYIGINGWYAEGQAYAYLQGELGVNVSLFSTERKIPILKGNAAVLLQAKGPNPYWMSGYTSGSYNILGGLVKGDYRFKVTLGETCEMENVSPINGLKMITDLTPNDGQQNTDVFTAPQATFAMKVNEPIIISEDQGDKYYKVILESFTLKNTSGQDIEGVLDWGKQNDRVTFVSQDILPPDTTLKAKVKVSFQERINGVYKTITHNGKKVYEIEERTFTTGNAPDYIPLHNIVYSYPVVNQKYFLKNEYPQGYIQLKRGQDYLFDNSKWASYIKYEDENGSTNEVNFTYNNAANKLAYTLPKLNTSTAYSMHIFSKTKGLKSKEEVTRDNEIRNIKEGNRIEIRKNKAQLILKEATIKRLSYNFKTSNYNSFKDKINTIKPTDHYWNKVNSKVITLENKVATHEGFDVSELLGNSYTGQIPLITVESSLNDTYFLEDIDPLLYQNYKPTDQITVSRDVNVLGFKPKKAIVMKSNYVTSLEHDTNIAWRKTRFPFQYSLMEMYNLDYRDIYNKVSNAYINGVINTSDKVSSILGKTLPLMRFGTYEVTMTYTLPGNISGSKASYKFKNPIKN